MKPFKTIINGKPTAWVLLAVAAAMLMTIDPVFAGSAAKGGIDWATLTQKLLGGLALFLFGLDLMTDSMRHVAGDKMKNVLGKMTTNRLAFAYGRCGASRHG